MVSVGVGSTKSIGDDSVDDVGLGGIISESVSVGSSVGPGGLTSFFVQVSFARVLEG